ncbi:MAG: aminotransferase [Mesorhizobium sp.]|nr:aminotransferase [Mesorhizobium sp.]
MTHARLNPLIAGQSPPPVPAVQAWARAYDGRHGPLLDLSQAVPGYPPHPDLLAWLGEAAADRAFAGYGPIEGEAALRQAYAAHVGALYGAALDASNIQITSGCNQAFFAAAMAIAGAGERILMTNPCYFNHETTLAMLGIGIDYVDLDPASGFLPDPDMVEAAFAQGAKALALVTPNNPTGAVYPPDLLRRLFDICREKGAWLILDETYRDFLPPGSEPPHGLMSVAGWEDNLVQLYSFSKSFCIPGHRLGAVTASPAMVGEIAKIMDNLQICAPRPPQAAVARGLPALAEWRETNRHEIMARTQALRAAMAALPGWQLQSLGAYFAFVRHPFGETPSRVVAERMAGEAGVLVIPGEFFGRRQEGSLRFAFANADSAAIRTLPERLAVLG